MKELPQCINEGEFIGVAVGTTEIPLYECKAKFASKAGRVLDTPIKYCRVRTSWEKEKCSKFLRK